MTLRSAFSGLVLGGAFLLAAPLARAAEKEVPTAFFISKSENKNQVHYAVKVDDACAPVGNEPVRPYWRMLELGPSATEPMLGHEMPAYGLASQRVTERSGAGGTVQVTLRAYPSRVLTIVLAKAPNGQCTATTHTTIGGHHAQLQSIHLMLRFLGVDSVILQGTARGTGQPVREVVKPRR
jgi:hypothetical protein